MLSLHRMNIKAEREKLKITQRQLATDIDVHQETVARWESTGVISKVYLKILTEYFKAKKP